MDEFDGCPACDGSLIIDDSFDQREDEGNPGPRQGYRFVCNECDEEIILAILHYPNGEYVGIWEVDDEICWCGNAATYAIDRSASPIEHSCGMCIFDLYSKVYIDAVKFL